MVWLGRVSVVGAGGGEAPSDTVGPAVTCVVAAAASPAPLLLDIKPVPSESVDITPGAPIAAMGETTGMPVPASGATVALVRVDCFVDAWVMECGWVTWRDPTDLTRSRSSELWNVSDPEDVVAPTPDLWNT